MQRKLLLSLGLLLCLPALARGAIIITAPNAILQPNLANQVVDIKVSATAGETAYFADVFTKINGGVGGLPASGFAPPEAPAVTLISLSSAGLVFNAAPFGAQLLNYPTPWRVSPFDSGTQASRSVYALNDPESGDFPNIPIGANSILAKLTISTVGIMKGPAPKVWTLELNNSLGDSQLLHSETGTWASVTTLVNGSLTILPEPSSVALGVIAMACLAMVAIRRRAA